MTGVIEKFRIDNDHFGRAIGILSPTICSSKNKTSGLIPSLKRNPNHPGERHDKAGHEEKRRENIPKPRPPFGDQDERTIFTALKSVK